LVYLLCIYSLNCELLPIRLQPIPAITVIGKHLKSVYMTNEKRTFGPRAMFRFWLFRTGIYLIATPILTIFIALLLIHIGVVPTILGSSSSAFLLNILPIGALLFVVITWFSLKTLRCKHCGSHLAIRATDRGVTNGHYTTWPVRCKLCNTNSSIKIKTTGANQLVG